MGIVEQYLLQLKNEKRRLRRISAILVVLSLLVATGVSWNLRLTGITIANGATCGQAEHVHTVECPVEKVQICGYDSEIASGTAEEVQGESVPDRSIDLTEEYQTDELTSEHIHVDECYRIEYQCGYEEHLHSLICYSNPKADVESHTDWETMFEDYPYTGDLHQDLAGIAKTQVGYSESALNFETDNDEVRHGYTRYGAWYGAPYNEWSAMFVSFCLHYSGADLSEYPINSGANTMAGLWDAQGRYIQTGEYFPVAGDLVFFENNTVGIVAEVQNATMYVICGDIQDSVSGSIMSVDDGLIAGWGMIDKPFADDSVTDKFSKESNTFAVDVMETRSVTDLSDYLLENGGEYFYTLTNDENENLDPDNDHHYVITANEGYKLIISIDSPNGIESGEYRLQLPKGLLYDEGAGEIIMKNGLDESLWVSVGTWEVKGDGLITIVFNEEMDSLTENVLNATIGVHFPEQNESIDFDGKITVTVQPPAEQLHPTTMLKGGHQGDEAEGEDPTKVYWSVQIKGDKDSQIVGNILTDSIVVGAWSKAHHYTESDIARGIHFGVWENDNWHDWDVPANDPNLTWTETGWSYKIPETARCDYCGEIELGDEGWTYNVSYTSTPDYISLAGKYGYENIAGIDGKNDRGWADFTQGDSYGVITKAGTFVSDAGGGDFVWEIQATVPGRAPDKKADYYWYLMDYLYMYDKGYQNRYYVHNDADLSEVTAQYQGDVIRVPNLENATENDMFTWFVTWSPTDNGIEYGREIVLLCRCHCNENNCQFWNGKCGGQFWGSDKFCHCWTAEEDVTLTFVYKTDALPLIEKHGGQGYTLQNIAELYYKPDPNSYGSQADSSVTEQMIPGVFKKDITKDFDGYTAHYQITVNEAKAVLTNGDPLIIKDTMSDTLAYISGSLVVKAEDVDGNLTELKQGEHYTVSYNGRDGQSDELGNKVHVLQITILTPQPVKYFLDYDTMVLKPDTINGAVMYTNYATITLWGDEINSDIISKITGEFNIAAKNYSVKLHKTCALTKQPLEGAVFRVYNEQGGLIASGETGNDGYLIIETDLKEGIILREHELYYAQEYKSPESYILDDTEQWFIFCNSTDEICDTCQTRMGDKNAVRIPLGQIGIMDIVNEPIAYELPATGGTGIMPYILCGLVLISAPLVYGLSLKHKHERRSPE